MPRKIDANTTLDDMDDERFFTRAALRADPDAAEFLAQTDTWGDRIDEVRKLTRETLEAVANADAARAISNARLDSLCGRFGDELVLAVNKDRKHPRFMQFFRGTSVKAFCMQAFGRQLLAVRAWAGITDDVFARHKDPILTWTTAGEASLAATAATAGIRGKAQLAREALAQDFTRDRDALHADLSDRARERGLPRDWADAFFRVTRRRAGADEGAVTPQGEGSPT
jgi:hypothetical protein